MLLLENNIKINKELSSVFSIKSFKFLTKKSVINGKISNKIKTYKSLKSLNYSNNIKTLQKLINLLLPKIKHNNLKSICMIVLKNYYKPKVILTNLYKKVKIYHKVQNNSIKLVKKWIRNVVNLSDFYLISFYKITV